MYNKLMLKNGDILSDVHLNHIENGVVEVERSANQFKKTIAKIVTAKGVPAYETDSFDTLSGILFITLPELSLGAISFFSLAISNGVLPYCPFILPALYHYAPPVSRAKQTNFLDIRQKRNYTCIIKKKSGFPKLLP